VYCGKTAESIRVPFGVVSGVGRGPRYRQSKSRLNYRHSSTRQWKNGVLSSTTNYDKTAHLH